MLSYARDARLSVFILFVDLVKAFDRCIRELVFGFLLELPVEERVPALIALGLCAEAANFIAEQVTLH